MKCNDRKLTVVYFSHYTAMYGANRSLFEMIKALSKYNIEAIVITPRYGEINRKLDELNVINTSFRFYYWTRNIDSKLTFAFKMRKMMRKWREIISETLIISWLKNKEVNIVHTNSSVIKIGAKIARKIKKPHVWHIREYGEEDYNQQFEVSFKAAVNYIENRSEKIIFISNDLKEKYNQHLKNKYQIIYNGVEKNTYYCKRDKSEFYEEKIKVILCGLIQHNKNQKELIEAVALMEKKYLNKLEINIVGNGDNDYISNLKKYTKENCLDKQIVFHGQLDDVSSFIKGCHVAVVPSIREAFGRVTVECMLAGNGVIVSNTGANSEIVNDCIDGLVYTLGNAEDLGKKLIKYIDDRDFLYTCSVNGQNKALNYFTSDINAQNINKVYRSL